METQPVGSMTKKTENGVTTAVYENAAKKKLKAGELVLCMAINQMRSAEAPMIAARCGFDAIFLDLDFALSLRIALSVVFGAGVRVYLVTLRPLALVARLLWYSVSRDSSRCVERAMAYSASR